MFNLKAINYFAVPLLFPMFLHAQLTYNRPFALEVKGHGYLEYQEREYGINLVWNQYPVYQWELHKNNASGAVPVNAPVALYNTQTKDYVVYASREYGINLKWLRDTDRSDPNDWQIEGSLVAAPPCFFLKNRTLAQRNEKPYLVYGEREYGINLVWGNKPSVCNMVALPVKTRYDKRSSVPMASGVDKALFDKAQGQMDVVGSDLKAKKFIGLAPAERENVLVSHTDTWFPIDGYKQTICGKLTNYFPFDGSVFGDNDDDLNLNIVPYPNTPSQRLLNDMQAIAWKKSGKTDPYKHVQAEIDVIDASYKPVFYPGKPFAPQKNEDDVCAFGPWVMDGGDDHYYKPEIHTAEQIWWQKGTSSNSHYYLSYMCDNSGRFDGLTDDPSGRTNTGDDYDTEGGKISFNGPWAPRPIEGVFAIAFQVRPGKEKVFFNINKIAGQNFQPVAIQPENAHFLIVKSDTLALVVESDGLDLNVAFENICQATKGGEQYVQGCVVLKAKTGKPNTAGPGKRNDNGGQLLLKVSKLVWSSGSSSFRTGFNAWKQ